jgi:6-phosphogluconolactonase
LTDGLLILVNAAVSVGGTAPSSIAIDPLDRFVFVTDSGANTSITVFSFDVTTGKVAKIGSSAVIASGAGQAAVDATGTYLYAALAGTPGSVAAFKIGAGGTLTAVAGSPFPATGNGTLGVAISNSIK